MRVEDLHHNELLELDPEGGLIRFAGQRALLFDAMAMGLLRKNLADELGLTAARALLTRFGFAHGWRMAEAVHAFGWSSDDDWRRAGPRIYSLEGLFRVEPGSEDPLGEKGAMLLASYEAEQHLLHFGRSSSAVCWTICGLMSGYVSRTVGKEIYVIEDRCLGKGHAACHMRGRSREEWGEEHASELGFFESGRLKENLDLSLQRVTDALKAAENKLHARQRKLTRLVPEIPQYEGIVAVSTPMKKIVDLACRIAKVDATVLITGESGSGKEHIARLIHEESPRAAGPFIAVNCGAITETLLESELFGHARGAFTGASTNRPGLFEAANHGTLLLDEIGEVSPAMQVKLLRVLQEREVRRVGENNNRRVDVRVLAATNRDLVDDVSDNTFRQDLYYRLKVVEIKVPPLRERREDILPLARIMLELAAHRMDRQIGNIAPAAAEVFLRYDWPGNVRELENAIERAVALARGSRVEIEDLPEELRETIPAATLKVVRPLEAIEKDHILAALEFNDGNQTRTAEQLGIGTATLYRKLKKYREADEDE